MNAKKVSQHFKELLIGKATLENFFLQNKGSPLPACWQLKCASSHGCLLLVALMAADPPVNMHITFPFGSGSHIKVRLMYEFLCYRGKKIILSYCRPALFFTSEKSMHKTYISTIQYCILINDQSRHRVIFFLNIWYEITTKSLKKIAY